MRNSAILEQFYFKAKLITALVMFLSIGGTLQAQIYPESQPETTAEAYSESALRRFEIIFLTSLPFTTIHSYLAVRGIRMIKGGTVTADLADEDYKTVGASAVAFSLFIGFWDWLHTHDKSPSQPRIPSTRESEKAGSGVALLTSFGGLQKTVNHKSGSGLLRKPPRQSETPIGFHLPMERNGASQGYFVPLLQVRF